MLVLKKQEASLPRMVETPLVLQGTKDSFIIRLTPVRGCGPDDLAFNKKLFEAKLLEGKTQGFFAFAPKDGAR